MQVELENKTDHLPMTIKHAYDSANNDDKMPCTYCETQKEKFDGKRMHFHGSDLGDCERKVYFQMSKKRSEYPAKEFSVSKMFLKDGHAHELSMLDALQKSPEFEVHIAANTFQLRGDIPWFNDADSSINVRQEIEKFVFTRRDELLADSIKRYDGKKKELELDQVWRLSDSVRHYHLIGHLDAMATHIDPEDGTRTNIGIECKAVKEEAWRRIKTNSEIPDVWYGQVQAYMFLTGIQVFYIMVKNRVTSNLMTPIRIDYNPKYVAQRIRKLNKVYTFANAKKEVPKDPLRKANSIQCKFCDFKSLCY